MREVLSYPLGPLPWALATPDGELMKTNKAKLMELMEKGQQPEKDIPATATWIYDGMALLQALRPALLPETF